jgi:hypothetical protein
MEIDNGISAAQKELIMDVASAALYAYLRDGTEPDCSPIERSRFDRLQMTVRHRGARAISVIGEGETAADQLANAIYSVCTNTSHGGLTFSHVDGLNVEIWVQTYSELVAVELRNTDRSLTGGAFGVEVQWNDACAHFDPSVILDRKFKSPAELLNELCLAAGLFQEAWHETYCLIRKQRWIHLCQDQLGKTVELFALRAVAPDQLSKDDLRSFIDQGASFLINNQSADGNYCYIYQALEGEGQYRKQNMVRASGCAYAMTTSARVVSPELSPRVLSSSRRAIGAVLKRTEKWGEEGLIVREDGGEAIWGKLGSGALAAVAILELDDPTFHPDALRALLQALKKAQRSDGLFDCFFGIDRPTDSVVNYYPGEALLALAISGSRGDVDALECCRRAFLPYRQHFRKAPSSAFVGWHVDVWSRLALTLHDGEYASFVFEQLDWLLAFQRCEGDDAGGFALEGKSPGVSSTVYTEAAIRGAALAHALGLHDRCRTYAEAGRFGLLFCARLQLNAALYGILPNPQRALGGVTGNLRTFQVRADNVQHMMTMAQTALELSTGWSELLYS